MPSPCQRILVVDDDPGIITAVKQTLSFHGFIVTTASSGKNALTAFENEAPDLVLLDLILPDGDGLEVCRAIREHSSTPLIVVSVKGSEADIVTLLEVGADDYLVKPFRVAELLARVRAVLRRASALPTSMVT